MARKRRRRPRPNLAEQLRIAYEVSRLFFETGMTLSQIRDAMKLEHVEQVRRYLRLAYDEGVNRLVPPLDKELAAKIVNAYGLAQSRLLVVDTVGSLTKTWTNAHGVCRSVPPDESVAVRTARLVMRLTKLVGATRWPDEPVTIGFSSGRACVAFCKYFSQLVWRNFDDGDDGVDDIDDPSRDRLGPIKMVTLSGCSLSDEPQYTSSAAYEFFRNIPNVEFVPLNSHTLVRQREYERGRIHKAYGVRRAFAERDNIDIVVTSMGDISDRHDNLRKFMRQSGVSLARLVAKHYLGSFQYRPYSATGPIVEDPDELRAVTVFELSDFAKLVQAGKHIVLMGRSCALCHGVDRSAVLRPLLTEPSLKICNNLVIDMATARGLLSLAS